MSWNVAITRTPVASLEEELYNLIGSYFANQTANDDAKAEAEEQARAAIGAAIVIAQTKCVFPPEQVPENVLVNVSISGHANPGHGEREGFSKDTVTVTVSQS